MRLDQRSITEERDKWLEKGYTLPVFDREETARRTAEAPIWVHFGAGNLFRAFHAAAAQQLLNEGVMDRGIITAESPEMIDNMERPHDDLRILVTLKGDGSVEKTVIGSVTESIATDDGGMARLREIFAADSLQLATFTITEKGYSLADASGKTMPEVLRDLERGPHAASPQPGFPDAPESFMGRVASLLYARFLAGGKPIAMVSTDNCSHNGDKLLAAIRVFAEGWEKNGTAEPGFAAYIEDPARVSFPWTMIDKITPRPDPEVEKLLRADGIEGLEPYITARRSYCAPFVNAEETQYLVVEDVFPNGRPELEKAGILFTDRQTVEKVERMKVCTCLNPLHTALAVFGCLLGYTKISDEMKDEDLVRLVEGIGYREGLPVVTDPGILSPREFIDTVLSVRVPNPFMPDTPQRIATDTSQKLSVRYGETVKAYLAAAAQGSPVCGSENQASDGAEGSRNKPLDVHDLKLIPLVYAGWIRYLMAKNDDGQAFELSPDPLLPAVCPLVAGLELRPGQDVESAAAPILHRKDIFGFDVYETGLAGTVLDDLAQLMAGPGAVRATLHRAVTE